MDPSHNAWATPNPQSPPVPTHQSLSLQVDHTATFRNAPDQNYQDVIGKLVNEIEQLKANIGGTTSSSQSKSSKGKQSVMKLKASVSGPSVPAPKKKAPPQTTPKRAQRAASAPPEFMNEKKTPKPKKSPAIAIKPPTPKRHPQQLQTGDFPAEFTPTKILWGLLKQDSVPKAPELSTLEEFYKRFRRTEQIEEAVKKRAGSKYSNQLSADFLKNAQAGRVKYGRSVIHLGSNFVRYAQGLMGQLGLRVWCPNLDEDAASLYNAAHRIAALTTFSELAMTPAYAYLNVNPDMAQDMTLLIPAYNHFVHYLAMNKYKKEAKQAGKVAEEANNKKYSKNRERLRDQRRDFAILNKFPKRYQDVLAQISAHSDDEEVPGKGFYEIKTLPYRSQNANKFFRRLENLMNTAAKNDPLAHRSRRRVRRCPKAPKPSFYTVAPKGLPIDFYHPKWYHQLPDFQKRSIPDTKSLAFLPDAKQSLLPKPETHPDEKLKNSSFTRKYWEVLAEPYGLVGGDSSESEASQEEEDSDEEGIDLTQPSPDASEDEYFDEGDAGDLYDQEDDFVASDDEEQGGHEEGGGSDDDEEDGDYMDGEEGLDGDCMMVIPEGEENWE
ncbi:hypothetical protein VP01_510g22 [Puccinia sorghi]|uniref:Uncharacterized protein n=1 Tax=Puccinia sorghi TaxID=27349 RepID=A0A0L6UN74_9BASI|nr:hypothetical protein VP01_510g22 [Puccinia sorghi]